jgi:geranylgeranyl reductase
MQPEELQQEYDVVIVGAGPGGCTAARYLSDKFSVLVIDSSPLPREKPCGGLLVEESQSFIKQLEPLEFVFAKPKKVKLTLADWENDEEVEVEREYVNVVRSKFDYWMVGLVENGVKFMGEARLVDFFDKPDHVTLLVAAGGKTYVIKARYLIGADGASSIIRRKLYPKQTRTYVAIQESVECEFDSHSYFIYDSDITDFYSWVIPKGSHVVVGSAMQMDGGDIRKKFSLLKRRLKSKMGIEGEYTQRESCLILRPETLEDVFLGRGHVLMVGEAAGLISPSTAEGISFALRSGKMCAHAINKMKDVLKDYKTVCQPLVDEVSDKLIKSEALSDPDTRKKVLERWHALSEPDGSKKAIELWAK